MPLDLLEDEYTFGMNRIGMICHPTFLWVGTRYVRLEEYRSTIIASIKSAYYAFVALFLNDVIDDLPNIYWIDAYDTAAKKKAHAKIIKTKKTFEYSPFKWKKRRFNGNTTGMHAKEWAAQEISYGRISAYAHSGHAVIRLAAYMGFNPIYLLGFDAHYTFHEQGQPDPNYFNKSYQNGEMGRPKPIIEMDNEKIWDSHNIMSKGLKYLGIEVFNVGRDTKLTQYQRLRFEDLLNGQNNAAL